VPAAVITHQQRVKGREVYNAILATQYQVTLHHVTQYHVTPYHVTGFKNRFSTPSSLLAR